MTQLPVRFGTCPYGLKWIAAVGGAKPALMATMTAIIV